MSYCPIFLDLRDQAVLIVGGSDAAFERCHYLVKKGALVTVWTSEVSEQFMQLKEEARDHLSILKARLTPEMAQQIFAGRNAPRLLILASQDHEYNARLEAIAEGAKIFVSNLDNPATRAQFAAVVEREEMQIAVHAARAPQLSSAVAEDLATKYPKLWQEAYKRYLHLAESSQIQNLKASDRRQELQKLARALVKTEGQMDDALGLLAGEVEISHNRDDKEE